MAGGFESLGLGEELIQVRNKLALIKPGFLKAFGATDKNVLILRSFHRFHYSI